MQRLHDDIFFKLDPGLWLMNSTHPEKNKVKELAKCEIMSDVPQYGDVKSTLYDRSSEKSLHSQQKYLLALVFLSVLLFPGLKTSRR